MKNLLAILLISFCVALLARDPEPNPGTAVFKLKPEYRAQILLNGANTGIPSLDVKLQSLKATAVKPYFSTDRSKSQNHEISLIFKAEGDFPPQAAINLLSRDPHVEYAEVVYPDEVFAAPNDPNYPASLYFAALEAEAAWDIHKGENGSSPVILGIVDTGSRWTHPDLADNIWNNLGEDANANGYTIYYNGSAWVYDPGDLNGIDDDGNGRADDLIGWDFKVDTGDAEHYDPYEASGHGTNVSGIINARTNNALGVASLAWNLTLMPVSCSYPGSNNIFRGYEGIIYAAEMGADIINCSWGGSGFSQANQTAINYAASLGATIVAAAGNSNNTTPIYPAAYQNVLATAALQNDGVKSSVSSYGAFVDVGAPNSSVGTTVGSGYGLVSGATSYASPIATSLAGLVKSYLPAITQAQLINRIKGSCDDVDAVNPGKENLLGEGKLNARRALAEADPMPDQEVRLYLLENRGASDANANQAVEPGETFSVNLTLRSCGSYGANGNFLLSTTNPAVTILSNSHNQAIPADGYLYLDNVFSIQALPSASSQYVTFTLATTADLPVVAGSTLSFSILIHAGGVFVWEGVAGGRDMSGAFIRTTLQGLGYACTYGTTFPSSLYSFEAVFLSFGAVGSNIVRFDKNSMFTALREYLEAGGRVYIEGVDVVGFDMSYYLPDVEGGLDAHEILWPLLGISNADDGSTNPIDGLVGADYTPGAGIVFSSSTQTKVDYIDTFTPMRAISRAAFTESDYGCVAVAGAGDYSQRSFVFSYALRELVDDAFPNTRANLLAQIMAFFEAEEITLPVELSSFTASLSQDNQAVLSWTAESETGLRGYYLHRGMEEALDSAALISPLIPAANSSQQQVYHYTDGELYQSGTYYYWLQSSDLDGASGWHGPISLVYSSLGDAPIPGIPLETGIGAIWPNPFNPLCYINYGLSEPAAVRFRVYNARGQLLRSLDLGEKEAGNYRLEWNGCDDTGAPCASGIYHVIMCAGDKSFARKAALVK